MNQKYHGLLCSLFLEDQEWGLSHDYIYDGKIGIPRLVLLFLFIIYQWQNFLVNTLIVKNAGSLVCHNIIYPLRRHDH